MIQIKITRRKPAAAVKRIRCFRVKINRTDRAGGRGAAAEIAKARIISASFQRIAARRGTARVKETSREKRAKRRSCPPIPEAGGGEFF
jgi:hypothetical protein